MNNRLVFKAPPPPLHATTAVAHLRVEPRARRKGRPADEHDTSVPRARRDATPTGGTPIRRCARHGSVRGRRAVSSDNCPRPTTPTSTHARHLHAPRSEWGRDDDAALPAPTPTSTTTATRPVA